MLTKRVDKKGRITLGDRFSGSTMLVEESDDGTILLHPAVTVPVHEAWLWKNKTALDGVTKGLAQAARHEFVKGPDLDTDAELAQRLKG